MIIAGVYCFILYLEKVKFGDNELHSHDHPGEHQSSREHTVKDSDDRSNVSKEDGGLGVKKGKFGLGMARVKKQVDLEDLEEEFKDTVFKNKSETLKQLKDIGVENVENVSNKKLKNFFVSIILLLTLSIHGFFEGMALGLTKSEKSMFNIFTGKPLKLYKRSHHHAQVGLCPISRDKLRQEGDI